MSAEPTTEQLAEGALHVELDRIEPLRSRARAARPSSKDSPCREDLTSELGLNVPNLTSLKLASAGDHLHAVEALIRKDAIPTWAHYSLLRVATEAALDVRWMLDPTLDSGERIGRAVSRARLDFQERAKAEQELGHLSEGLPSDFVAASEHIKVLEAAATAAGIPIPGFPGSANLAVKLGICGSGLDGWNVRYLGGAIHSTQWAASLGDVDADDTGEGVNIKASSTSTWYSVRCAVRHFAAAVEAMETYVGAVPDLA